MKNKLSIMVILSIAAIMMAGCSSSAKATQAAAVSPADLGNAQASQGQPAGKNPTLSTEEKLAAGTLKLEGTDLAVTADQAKQLLPLWQQIQTLSGDQNTTSDQLQKVYDQIKGAMTSDQLAAIEKLTMDDIQSEMSSLGIQVPTGMPGDGKQGNPPQQSGTPMAPQGKSNGNPPAAPDAPDGTPGAQPQFQGTPDAGQGGGRNGGGMGMMGSAFIDPLITLLQQRAGK